MSAAHTPGPWVVGGSFDNEGVTEIVIERIADKGTLAVAVALAGLLGQDANARLIAESPNLLKVLTDLVANQDATWVAAGFTDEQIKAMPYLKPARAAIAKAGGAA